MLKPLVTKTTAKITRADVKPGFYACCQNKPAKLVSFTDESGVIEWHESCAADASTVSTDRIRDLPREDGKKTPSEWRAMAKESRKEAYDSFERCDTDGFLSQAASQAIAREYNTWAELAENDYQWSFRALFDLDGNLLDAELVNTAYGMAWRIRTAEGTKWFRESMAKKGARRLATDEKKGYRLGTVKSAALVKMGASWVCYMEPMQGAERTVVDDGSQKTQYSQDW